MKIIKIQFKSYLISRIPFKGHNSVHVNTTNGHSKATYPANDFTIISFSIQIFPEQRYLQYALWEEMEDHISKIIF